MLACAMPLPSWDVPASALVQWWWMSSARPRPLRPRHPMHGLVVVIHELCTALAWIVAGQYDAGMEVADLLSRQTHRHRLCVGRLVDDTEPGRELPGRLDHVLVELQPHSLVERDSAGQPPPVPVGGPEPPPTQRARNDNDLPGVRRTP